MLVVKLVLQDVLQSLLTSSSQPPLDPVARPPLTVLGHVSIDAASVGGTPRPAPELLVTYSLYFLRPYLQVCSRMLS